MRMLLKKGPKRFFWIKIWNYRILCFPWEKKDENQRHRWSFFPSEKCCRMNVLFTCQKERAMVLKGWESRGLYYGGAGRRGCGHWQPPCQAAVNKASAELKNGNEFLIGDTLYLSSWQRSDCTAAFLFCPCARITSPYVPLHDTPYLPGSLTCEERRKT